MPATTTIAPITGMLRKRIILDLGASLGLGIATSYAYWYGYYIPKIKRREEFYANLQRESAE